MRFYGKSFPLGLTRILVRKVKCGIEMGIQNGLLGSLICVKVSFTVLIFAFTHCGCTRFNSKPYFVWWFLGVCINSYNKSQQDCGFKFEPRWMITGPAAFHGRSNIFLPLIYNSYFRGCSARANESGQGYRHGDKDSRSTSCARLMLRYWASVHCTARRHVV